MFPDDYEEIIRFKNNYGVYYNFLKSQLKINNADDKELQFF